MEAVDFFIKISRLHVMTLHNDIQAVSKNNKIKILWLK